VFAPMPPLTNSAMRMRRTFLFRAATSTVTGPIERPVSSADLCATVATCISTGPPATLIPLFAAVRLHRVRVWQPYSTVATDAGALISNACGVFFEGDGTAFYSPVWIQKISLDFTQPAYIDVRPPRGSAVAEWLFPSSSEVMRLQFSIGAIVAVDLEATIYQNGMPNTPSTISVGTPATPPAPGNVNRMPLDFGAGGAIGLMPVDAWIQLVTP